MFEELGALAAGWRTLLHVSEWTGLSVGAIAALAGLVWLNPGLLRPALIGAGLVALVYAGILYGDATGRADVHAQWEAARRAAEAAQAQRDAEAQARLEATYRPQLDALARDAEAARQQGADYERKILELVAKEGTPAGACRLGDALARRLHDGR